jgi:hypothetical protein
MRKPAPRMPLPALLTLALLAPSSGCTRDGARSDAGLGSAEDTWSAWDASLPDSALPGFDATCESIVLRSTPTVSNVLVVLDRSSSMYREAGFGVAGVDRWNPAVAAIQNVTASLDDRVQFGLMLFANPDAPAGMTLCGAGKVDVAPAPDTGPVIAAELTGDPNELTGSWTPTAVSLDAARTALVGLSGRSYVLLVTDGAPNCNSDLDGTRCRCGSDTMSCSDNPRLCIDEDRTVAAVAALHDVGVDTFVVGYETSTWADVLDRMAAAGGTGRTTHIPVDDEASLRTALTEIAGSVISCTVELSGPPDVVEFVHVTLDGVDVPHESVATGDASWALVDEHFVELRGSACSTLRDGGEHDLAIRRECQPLF